MAKRIRKKPSKQKVSLPTKLMLLVNLVFAFLLACSLLACYISPTYFWPIAFAGIAYPLFLAINLFFVLFWLVFLKKYFLLSLITILLGFNQFNSLIQLRGSNNQKPSTESIKVMSYNVRLFDLYNWKNNKEFSKSREQIFGLFKEESADILCLQEYYSGKKTSSNYADTIMKSCKFKNYFDAYIDNGKKELPFGLATFSKFPIVSGQKISFLNTYQNFCIITDIALPTDTIRVINTHLESIKFGKEDYIFVNELTNNSGKGNDLRQGIVTILGKMMNAYKKRAGQADELVSIIKESPYRVLLCADFNDTPASYVYRQIARIHNDSFKEAGSGLGQTYTQLLPILRIDYIFADESMKVLNYRTIHNNYSDHYPIVANIQM
ncbi:MAG: endonuclease/exonuclease/phosphatase family protein [Bacteroidetes bacterium]|nr:endonuclease/exonuclease/phosphatase family protein [Bacteroidota bacterium]